MIKFWLSLLLAAVSSVVSLAQSRGPNVVIILSDQLRADRLHVYGNSRPTSPNLDQLAAQGVVLRRFYAVAPWTAPSQGSLATSLFPSRHGETIAVPRPGPPAFSSSTQTLAGSFAKAGYATVAFVNNAVSGNYLLGQGFLTFDEQCGACSTPESKAPAVNRRIGTWLDANKTKPFFMYVNYWEPHYPYAPPPEHDVFRSDAYAKETSAGYSPTDARLLRLAKVGDRAALTRTVQLYDGYVHYMDYYLGQLMDAFRSRGLFDNTIFFFTSDHGELLYAHPDDYLVADHRSLYDAVLRVPGIFWGKSIPAGVKLPAITSNIDIMPTLLELAGLPPNPTAQGVSLAPLIHGSQTGEVHDYVFAEQDLEESLRSVRDKRYKLILNEETGKQQLFDTQYDAQEKQDIAALFPDVVNQLSDVLSKWRAQNEPDPAVRDAHWRSLLNGALPIIAPSGPPPGEVIDDVANGTNVHLTGPGWRTTNETHNYLGGADWEPAARDDASLCTAVWRPNNPMFGHYRISMWYGTIGTRQLATNAPLTVVTKSGSMQMTLDQSNNQGRWNDLGVFENPVRVILSNTSDGPIVADAIKFERVD